MYISYNKYRLRQNVTLDLLKKPFFLRRENISIFPVYHYFTIFRTITPHTFVFPPVKGQLQTNKNFNTSERCQYFDIWHDSMKDLGVWAYQEFLSYILIS
jgi:hypothetical protein